MYLFLIGAIRFRFKSLHCESVINRLRYSVPVYKLKRTDKDTFEFTTGYSRKSMALSILDEMNAKVVYSDSYGILSLADRYKKRLGIWLGIMISVFLLYISSNTVWDIRVSGNDYVSDKDIINLLSMSGIKEGCFINKGVLENAYNEILIREPRIAWISVNYDGTVANVEIDETNIVPDRIDRDGNVNLIAACDGIVKRTDVFDGRAEVIKDETVTKGQLLISSFTESRKTGVFMRCARGNVWALTVHNYEISVKRSKVKREICDSGNVNSIVVLGRRIPAYIRNETNVKNMETDVFSEKYSMFGVYPMPFRIETKAFNTYLLKDTTITEDEAKAEAEKELKYRIDKDLHDAEVVKREERVMETDDEFIFIYELSCFENIAVPVKFEFDQ